MDPVYLLLTNVKLCSHRATFLLLYSYPNAGLPPSRQLAFIILYATQKPVYYLFQHTRVQVGRHEPTFYDNGAELFNLTSTLDKSSEALPLDQSRGTTISFYLNSPIPIHISVRTHGSSFQTAVMNSAKRGFAQSWSEHYSPLALPLPFPFSCLV